MPISKGPIPNSILCLIPKVLLQCPVSVHFMSNSKGLPTPILSRVVAMAPIAPYFKCIMIFGCQVIFGQKETLPRNFQDWLIWGHFALKNAENCMFLGIFTIRAPLEFETLSRH